MASLNYRSSRPEAPGKLPTRISARRQPGTTRRNQRPNDEALQRLVAKVAAKCSKELDSHNLVTEYRHKIAHLCYNNDKMGVRDGGNQRAQNVRHKMPHSGSMAGHALAENERLREI